MITTFVYFPKVTFLVQHFCNRMVSYDLILCSSLCNMNCYVIDMIQIYIHAHWWLHRTPMDNTNPGFTYNPS